MYAMNIKNDVIGLVLGENCKSKQATDFIAWASRYHDTILHYTSLESLGSALYVKTTGNSFVVLQQYYNSFQGKFRAKCENSTTMVNK